MMNPYSVFGELMSVHALARMEEQLAFGGGSVTVWGDISYEGRTELAFANVTL